MIDLRYKIAIIHTVPCVAVRVALSELRDKETVKTPYTT